MDLTVTSRPSSLSSKAVTLYTVHRADCTRQGENARPLATHPLRDKILFRARLDLNAKACTYCKPDLAPSDDCPGEGRKWGFGTGQPICPVCHRGVTALTGIQVVGTYSRALRTKGVPKTVPPHARRPS